MPQHPYLGLSSLIVEIYRSQQLDTHLVGLLLASDQLVVEVCTWTTHNKHNRRTSIPSAGVEAEITAIELLQTYVDTGGRVPPCSAIDCIIPLLFRKYGVLRKNMKNIMVTGSSGGLTAYSCSTVQDVCSADRHVCRSKVWSNTFSIASVARNERTGVRYKNHSTIFYRLRYKDRFSPC